MFGGLRGMRALIAVLAMAVSLLLSVGCTDEEPIQKLGTAPDSGALATGEGDSGVEARNQRRPDAGAEDSLSSERKAEDGVPSEDGDTVAFLSGPPVGHSWYVDMNGAVWARPENIDKLAESLGTLAEVFVGIHARSEGSADMIMSVGSGEAQDFCSRTIVMDDVTLFEDGLFRFGPRDFTIANGTLTQDLMIQGRFSQDFTKLIDMEVEGVVVLSTVPDDVLPLPLNTDPCELLGALEVECTPCDDGSLSCLDMRMVQFGGSLVEGLALEDISQADCHPLCEDSAENQECDSSSW